MSFVCIVFELGDKMLTLSSMENLIVQCNLLNIGCNGRHVNWSLTNVIRASENGVKTKWLT